jgi:hypothetical protein
MTRPEDAWSPSRSERGATIRFGTVSVVRANGNIDAEVVTGTTVTDVPLYGPAVVGSRVLLLHDGQKVVAVSDGGARITAKATTVASGQFTVPLPAGMYAAPPRAVATVETTYAPTTTAIISTTTALVTGQVNYWQAGAWNTAAGFLVHVHIAP